MAVAGTTVLGGRYTLLAVLGTGGMATVWRARDETLSRDVAVKVLNPQHAADTEFLEPFESEARHAAAVSHPRLVTVFDCGVEGGTPFIVMELVAGRTLRQVLDEAGMLPPGQAVAIAAAVCEGLEARAHRRTRAPRHHARQHCPGRRRGRNSLTSASPGPTPPAPRPRPEPSWAPSPTCHPSRLQAARLIRVPTCTRWAACCLRCSPASRRLRRIRRSGWPTGRSMTIPARRQPRAPACPLAPTRSPPVAGQGPVIPAAHRRREPGRGSCPSSLRPTACRS